RERNRRERRDGADPKIRERGKRAGTRRGSSEQTLSRGAAATERASADVEAARDAGDAGAGRLGLGEPATARAGCGGAFGALSRAGIQFTVARVGIRGGGRLGRGERGARARHGLRAAGFSGGVSRLFEEDAGGAGGVRV